MLTIEMDTVSENNLHRKLFNLQRAQVYDQEL